MEISFPDLKSLPLHFLPEIVQPEGEGGPRPQTWGGGQSKRALGSTHRNPQTKSEVGKGEVLRSWKLIKAAKLIKMLGRLQRPGVGGRERLPAVLGVWREPPGKVPLPLHFSWSRTGLSVPIAPREKRNRQPRPSLAFLSPTLALFFAEWGGELQLSDLRDLKLLDF